MAAITFPLRAERDVQLRVLGGDAIPADDTCFDCPPMLAEGAGAVLDDGPFFPAATGGGAWAFRSAHVGPHPPDKRGVGGTMVDGRWVRNYAGTTRPPDVWPETWQMMSKKERAAARGAHEGRAEGGPPPAAAVPRARPPSSRVGFGEPWRSCVGYWGCLPMRMVVRRLALRPPP